MPSYVPQLPPISPTKRSASSTSKRESTDQWSKNFVLKVPPWEQNTALKNWESLDPPSPYKPIPQRRIYPSVLSGFPRVVAARQNRQMIAPISGRAQTDVSVSPSRNPPMSFEEEEECLQLIMKDEKSDRDFIIFTEQHDWTHIWVNLLQQIGVWMETDINSAEENDRDTFERANERLRMCYTIELNTSFNRLKERFATEMRKRLSQIMPRYIEGRNAIIAEEAVVLCEVLEWNKKTKPFGMRMFASSDPRPIIPKKPTYRTKTQNTRGLTTKSALSAIKSVKSTAPESWPDLFPEPSYLEEGRLAWRQTKNMRYLQRRDLRSTIGVEEDESKAREDILAAESMAWLPLLASAIDELYDAKHREDTRERAEAVAIEEKLIELQRRELILIRLEEEAMAAREMEREMERESSAAAPDTRDGHEDASVPSSAVATSRTWGSDPTDAPLHPMLNVVLGVAIEKDPLAALRNPALAAVAESECGRAALHGCGAGRAADAFAIATHVPMCPAYLANVLWRDPHVAEEGEGMAQLEAQARRRVVEAQMEAVWGLYQKAAQDASRVSGTQRGEVYYLGLRLPREFVNTTQTS